MTTSTADGAMVVGMDKKKEDHLARGEFPHDEFKKGVAVEMNEHPEFSPLEAARLVLDHLTEDEYHYSGAESMAESFIADIGEDGVRELLETQE
jgi:hypothetical protein